MGIGAGYAKSRGNDFAFVCDLGGEELISNYLTKGMLMESYLKIIYRGLAKTLILRALKILKCLVTLVKPY